MTHILSATSCSDQRHDCLCSYIIACVLNSIISYDDVGVLICLHSTCCLPSVARPFLPEHITSLWPSHRDTSRPLYQRRVSSISRLLSLQWSYLLDPPGFLIATDDGGIVYEAGHPQDEGQSWQDAHLWRLESDKGGHGTRNITRESRCTLPVFLAVKHSLGTRWSCELRDL